MRILDTIREFLQDFFESVFASSTPEYKKKQQLKQLAARVKAVEPPIYQADGMLLPPFPATLYQIFQFLVPVRDTLNQTLASKDRRVSERYRDLIIELVLTDEQRALRKSLTFPERSAALLATPTSPERVIEEQGKQFAQYLKALDAPQVSQACHILERIEALGDFCQFDCNQFFSYFDPAFKAHIGQDTTVENPSFRQIEVAEVVPALLDLYYVISRLDLGPAVMDVVSILEARKDDVPLTEDIRNRNGRIAQAVGWLMQKRLGKDILLAIIRITKDDPAYQPELPTRKTDYLQLYRNRITEFFHSDSRRLLKEKQTNEIQVLITATFGEIKIEEVEGYNETTNTILQEFTPLSLEWIQPVQIIRTFALHFFEPHFSQVLRSIIVEGYFTNRVLQTSFSSAFQFCENASTKILEFESLFADNQPYSLKILTGYITEMEKGMDFEKPLRKMVENMNAQARVFVQQMVTQYAETYKFCLSVLEDTKRTLPELVTNVRALVTSTKNAESYGLLEKEIGVFHNFLEIMKKYAIVGTLSVPVTLAEQTER